MQVFTHSEFDGHETVAFCHDKASGLRAIIAIHDTRLGPALGGFRMLPYTSEAEALTDVLRLSRGMSYKNALAGLPLGGGKSVIIGDPRQDKTPALLEAFGAFVEGLNGRYITAEDSNTSPADMEIIARRTAHVRNMGFGPDDNPSPVTALGTFYGIEVGLEVLGLPMDGAKVVVEGLGKVGMDLAARLHAAGARLVVTDVNAQAVAEAVARFGAETVAPGTAHRVQADVYAPCALGAGLNARTIPELRARMVAGAANNQLETPQDGDRLQARGVLYCPDYVVNAGGVLGIPLPGERLTMAERMARATVIQRTTRDVLDLAVERDIPTHTAADRLAQEILSGGAMRLAAE